MRVERDDGFVKEVLGRVRRPYKRTGFHVSDALYCSRLAYFRKMGYEEEYSESLETLFITGKGHHAIMEILPRKEVRVEKDGVMGTIDMIGDMPTEIKTTRKSMSSDIPETYLNQLAAYCYMCGCSRGRLFILYLMGNYRPPTPKIVSYIVHFTPIELSTFWKIILMRKDIIEAAVEIGVPPEKESEFEWQCGNCSFRKVCTEMGDGQDKKSEEKEKM